MVLYLYTAKIAIGGIESIGLAKASIVSTRSTQENSTHAKTMCSSTITTDYRSPKTFRLLSRVPQSKLAASGSSQVDAHDYLFSHNLP